MWVSALKRFTGFGGRQTGTQTITMGSRMLGWRLAHEAPSRARAYTGFGRRVDTVSSCCSESERKTGHRRGGECGAGFPQGSWQLSLGHQAEKRLLCTWMT